MSRREGEPEGPVSLIVGTAGHIDHGKTELIKAMTGIDTDRLPEEKQRGISIDLGFAYLDLPGVGRVGIVDVPGHERFIKTMVAGASGMDIVLLVVAADEGVMPQTVEHLDVCRYLGVRSGVVAITKTDLVADAESDAVVGQVRELVRGTFLEGAPIVATSARTGRGIERLQAEMAALAKRLPARASLGVFRMPIDRSFSMRGFGTVVTGTVLSGSIRVGSQVAIYPRGLVTKVRRIETHKTEVEKVRAGQRAAMNLQRVAKTDVSRGDVLGEPGKLRASLVFDVQLRLNKSPRAKLAAGARVRFHIGTKEALGRIWPVGRRAFSPGFDGYGQIRLESPVVALFGDRFVLRTYSPALVIGGGRIVVPSSKRRLREAEALEQRLRAIADGPTEERFCEFVRSLFPTVPDIERLSTELSMDRDSVLPIVNRLCDQARLVRLSGGKMIHPEHSARLESRILERIENYHRDHPLRLGIEKSELASAFRHPVLSEHLDAFLARLEASGKVTRRGCCFSLPWHRPTLSESQTNLADKLRRELRAAGPTPVSLPDVARRLSTQLADSADGDLGEVTSYLVESNEAVRISGDLLIGREGLLRAAELICDFLARHKRMTVAQCRDLLSSSRRYVVPLLEYLDARGITRREGDVRVRGAEPLERLRCPA